MRVHEVAQLLGATFDPGDPASWIGGGAVAVAVMTVVFLFAKEWVVSGVTYRRVLTALEDERKKNDDLHALIEGRELETLGKVNTVLLDVTDVLRERTITNRVRAELKQEGHDSRDTQ